MNFDQRGTRYYRMVFFSMPHSDCWSSLAFVVPRGEGGGGGGARREDWARDEEAVRDSSGFAGGLSRHPIN